MLNGLLSKRLFICTCLLLTVISIYSSVAFSALTQDPSLQWHTLTTEHFEIHFHDGEKDLAREVADISERIHDRLSKSINWQPESRTQVVLTDRYDFSNGIAYPIPHNWMQLIVSPPDSFSSLNDYNNWLELLIIHEYTHVLHLDKVNGLPASLRNIFGRFLMLFPNLIQPPWLIEGLATYLETDIEQGTGRGQNSYFRMLMRLEVEQGIKPLSQINQPLVTWPMNTSRYLYGVYFFNFLHDTYGDKKVQAFIENYSDNLLPFAINSNSALVFGKQLDELWKEFSEYLSRKFNPEIERIQKDGLTTKTRITQSGYFTSNPRIASNGDVFFIQKDMQSEPRMLAIGKDQKKPRFITNTHGKYFDINSKAGIVITEVNHVKNTNHFSDLHHINPVTGKKIQITKGGRYLYASWSPDGKQFIAVQNILGNHALHLLNRNGKVEKILWQGKDKTVLGPPDWSPNSNQVVLSVWRPGKSWNLEIFNISSKQWHQLTNTSNIETTPQFSPDGKHVLYSADYNGVFNLHRITISNGNINTLSNVVGGAFSPVLSENTNDIYFIGASNNGFDLYQTTNSPKLTSKINIKTPVTISNASGSNPKRHTNKDNNTRYNNYNTSEYNAFPLILPTGWYPYLYTSTERTDVGLITWGSDPIKRHNYNIAMAYDAENKWFVGRLDYLYDRWDPTLKISIDKQAITYLDSNNVVERYRNLDTYTLEAMWPIFSIEQQWLFHAGTIHEIESDKDIQSNFGRLPSQKNDLVGIALSFNSSRRYPISISPSFGRQIRAVAENSDILPSYNTGQLFTLDWREFFDLPGQHVIAARGVLGFGTDNPDYFRLGGTKDTTVIPLPNEAAYAATHRIFGQREYPLRGYPEGRRDLIGRRIALGEAEWRFPISLIERGIMAPPAGIHQIHGKLFFNMGKVWSKESDIPSFRRGAGAEITTELVLGYWIPVNAMIGFAKGFDRGGESQAYVDISVKL